MNAINRSFGALRTFSILSVFAMLSGHAQVVAVRSIAGGNDTGSVADFTYGWRFTVDPSASLSVTHLGLLDMDASGFGELHRIGIWDGSDNLLTEVTLSAGESGTMENGFRYLPVGAPATLQAGQSYTIGSWNLGNSDNWITGSHFTTEYAAEIDYIGAGYSQTSGYASPKHNISLSHGVFGPNFKFEVSPVPEPREYMILAAAGLLAFSACRRHFRGAC